MKEPTKYLDHMSALIDSKLGIEQSEYDAAHIIAQRLGIAKSLGDSFFKGNVDATVAIFHELNEEARRKADEMAE